MKNEKLPVRTRRAVLAELDPKKDIDWLDALKGAKPTECVKMNSNDLFNWRLSFKHKHLVNSKLY